jgi:heme/copper-type cytochrome/quinol oxidase subunit 3
MSEILIFFGSMLALLAFVIWDRRRLTGAKVAPLDRKTMEKGFTPTGMAAWQASLLVGVMFGALTYQEWMHPSHPPFTGRLAWVREGVYAVWGFDGALVIWGALTCVCLLPCIAQIFHKINK